MSINKSTTINSPYNTTDVDTRVRTTNTVVGSESTTNTTGSRVQATNTVVATPYTSSTATTTTTQSTVDTATSTISTSNTNSTDYYVSGIQGLTALAGRPGVFYGANINVDVIEETTANYSRVNTPYGNDYELQFKFGEGFGATANITYDNAGNLVVTGIKTNNYMYANGTPFTGSGGGNASLGNWAFTANTMYNLNGGSILNNDLTHGSTSGLNIPLNGGTDSLELFNSYGRLALIAGSGGTTKTWSFDGAGNITLPTNTSSINYANGTPYSSGATSTGNIGFDNYNIYNTQGQGVIISNFNFVTDEAETAYVQIPAGNSTSDLSVVQEQGNVRLVANASAWSFNTDGQIITPDGTRIGNIEGANTFGFYNSNSNTEFILETNIGAYTFNTNGTLVFPNNANITTVDNTITQLNSVANGVINLRTFDAGGNTTASSFFDGADGTLNFYSYNPAIDTSYNWRFDNGGSFTLPNAPGNVYFGELANQPVILPGDTAITLNANRADTTQDYITVSQDGIDIFSVNSINIDNSTTGFTNSDINLLSGDDILLQGRDRPADEEREGGDLFIYGGNGSDASTNGFDPGGGGDLLIEAGLGGAGTGTGANGGSGGRIDINAGNGGTTVDAIAGSGGSINITAGAAATPVDPAFGGFGGDVTIRAGETTRVNENGGSITLWTGGGNGGGTGAAGYVEINIPSSNVGAGGSWTFTGTGKTLQVPADSEIYGASYGNFTVGCAGNTIVTSSDYGANVKNWIFGYTGNLLAPGNIITPSSFVGTGLRTNLEFFNWTESITDITTGATTVVTLANNVFGDPWTGQVTITGVTGAIEANSTWWYQAVDSNQFGLYTDNTFSTPVDSSAWGAYTGGGFAVTLDYGNIEINAQTVTIRSDHGDYNNKIWTFDNTGNLNLASNGKLVGVTSNNNGYINWDGASSGDGNGYTTLRLIPDNTRETGDQYLIIDPTAPGHIHIRAGGTQDNSNADLFLGGENTYFKVAAGSNSVATISSNSNVWQFGTDGNIVLPSGTPAIQTPDQSSTISLKVQGGATERSEFQIGSDGGTDQFVYISSINGTGNRVSLDMGAYAGNPAYAKIQTYDGVSVQNDWLFTTAPLDSTEALFYVPGGAAIVTPEATGGAGGKNIFIEAGYADQSTYSTSSGGDLYLKGGRGATNDGGGGGPGGDVWITAGESADPAGVAGNVNITAGAVKNWVFDNTGTASLPTVNNESAKLVGTRKVIGGLNAGAPYKVTLAAGGTPTLVYTSLPGTQSAKITFVAQSNGSGYQWEQFDVVATVSQDVGNTVNFVVSNRVKGTSTVADTVVTATMNGTQMEISLTLDAAQTSGGWANFDATEFGLMAD